MTAYTATEWCLLAWEYCSYVPTDDKLCHRGAGWHQGLYRWPCYLSSNYKEQVGRSFIQKDEVNLTINLPKSGFGSAHTTYLGHVVGNGQMIPLQTKIEALCDCHVPQNKKEEHRFLGMTGFFRKFCTNFLFMAASLTNLVKS